MILSLSGLNLGLPSSPSIRLSSPCLHNEAPLAISILFRADRSQMVHLSCFGMLFMSGVVAYHIEEGCSLGGGGSCSSPTAHTPSELIFMFNHCWFIV